MKFVIFREYVAIKSKKLKRIPLIEWTEDKIFEEIEKRLGKKGVDAFKEIIEEFKKETITIP